MFGVAFQTGLSFLDLGSQKFELASLVGATFRLPLIADESFQLGSSLAISAFWEKDLTLDDIGQGHHLVLQFGFNVGSLLSGAQNTK